MFSDVSKFSVVLGNAFAELQLKSETELKAVHHRNPVTGVGGGIQSTSVSFNPDLNREQTESCSL
jgi:hypothetical protein